MKKLTKEQLQAGAERLMQAHNAKTIFATQDGNYFLEKHVALSHLRELKKDFTDELEVFTFEADAQTEETKGAATTAPAKPGKQNAGSKPKEDKKQTGKEKQLTEQSGADAGNEGDKGGQQPTQNSSDASDGQSNDSKAPQVPAQPQTPETIEPTK